MFMGPKDELTLGSFLFKCVMPCMMLLVFWVNYLWIFPRFYQHESRRVVVAQNVVLVLLCSALLAMAHTVEFDQRGERRRAMEMPSPPRHEPSQPAPYEQPTPPQYELLQAGSPSRLRPPHHGKLHFIIFTGLRDCFTLCLVIIAAYAVLASRRMERMKREQQEAETARQEAELRGLRNQVSPHFLLNTLNNIYSLTLLDNAKAGEAVMELSRLLRHTLYESQGDSVSLVSEARFIHSYVELMRLRLARNVEVSARLDIDEQSETQVAPLLFISLLENAFKHGVAPAHACHIHISLEEDERHVHLHIANSLHPKTQEDRSGHGIGLNLVKKRLEHYYPAHYVWQYGPQGDEWVTDLTLDKTKEGGKA